MKQDVKVKEVKIKDKFYKPSMLEKAFMKQVKKLFIDLKHKLEKKLQSKESKKYTHRITFGKPTSNDRMVIDLVTSRSIPFTTMQQVAEELNNLGYTKDNGGIPLSFGMDNTSGFGFSIRTNMALVSESSSGMITYQIYKIAQEDCDWSKASITYQGFLKDIILN